MRGLRDNPAVIMAEQLTDRDALTRDVFAHFGLAMYLVQVLEHGIVNAMVISKMPNRRTITRQDIDAFMARQFEKPLGRLLRELAKHIAVPGDVEPLLGEVLAKRNWLAHHYFRERARDFVTGTGCRRMIDELEEVQQLLKHAEQSLDGLVRPIRRRYGVTDEAIAREAAQFYRRPAERAE